MFFKKGKFNSVCINGQTITCSGSNITISNGKVIVDGNVIDGDIAPIFEEGSEHTVVCEF